MSEQKRVKQLDGSYLYRGLTIQKAGSFWVADDPDTHQNAASARTLAAAESQIDAWLEAQARATRIATEQKRSATIGAVGIAGYTLLTMLVNR